MKPIKSNALLLVMSAFILLSSATAIAVDELKPGEPAPSLMARNIKGRMVYLSDHCGNRCPLEKKTMVVVHFFSTTCKPCLREIPALKKLRETYSPEQLTILMVSVADKPDKVAAYKEKWKLDQMSFLLDKYGYNAQRWKVSNKKDNSINFSLPYTFLVDKAGYIVGVYPAAHANLDELISKKINQN